MANNNNFYMNTNPNACRLCNQVFTTPQALLTHVESHIAQEKFAIKSLYSSPQHANSQMQLGSHQFPPQPIMGDDARIFLGQSKPMGMGMSQFFNSSQIGSSSSSSSMPIRQMHQVPPQPFPYSGSSTTTTNGDGSKAYISKLEKPIKKIDFIDLVNVDDDNNSVMEDVDLDLKL